MNDTSDTSYRVTADELRQFVERMDFPKISDMVAAMDDVECWRPVSGADGYFVSSWGQVRGKRVGALKQNGVRLSALTVDDGVLIQRVK